MATEEHRAGVANARKQRLGIVGGDLDMLCRQRIGQGRENAKQFMRDNPAVANAIEKKVRDQSGVVANAMMTTPDADEAAAAE